MGRIFLKPVKVRAIQYAMGKAFEGDNRFREVLSDENRDQFTRDLMVKTMDDAFNAKAKFFQVMHVDNKNQKGKDIIIGFAVIFTSPCPTLYSFGIMPRFRTSPILKRLMELVHALFKGNTYEITLPEKNRRAINFLEKNGFKKDYDAMRRQYTLCKT